MVAGTTTVADCGFWSSRSALGEGVAGADSCGAAPGADWACAEETKLGTGDAMLLATMATAAVICLCQRFPAMGKIRNVRCVLMRQSGLGGGVGLERGIGAMVGGQQRSALSRVLALENGENGRQDDQRGDGPPGQAADHG